MWIGPTALIVKRAYSHTLGTTRSPVRSFTVRLGTATRFFEICLGWHMDLVLIAKGFRLFLFFIQLVVIATCDLRVLLFQEHRT
jgi:hypothetical protein